jgi:hypothetical protein
MSCTLLPQPLDTLQESDCRTFGVRTGPIMLTRHMRLPVCYLLLLGMAHGGIVPIHGRGKANLELYHQDRTTLIGPLVDHMVLDLVDSPKLSIKASAEMNAHGAEVSCVFIFVDNQEPRMVLPKR